MHNTLQLGLYATELDGRRWIDISFRVPCEEHGVDYLTRHLEGDVTTIIEDPWSWAQQLLAAVTVDALCCADGWTKGSALVATPRSAE